MTQKQWLMLMGDSPSAFKGDNNPVEQVEWVRCMDFCRRLTQRERSARQLPEGYEYRLPTEAEWEYAARGGARSHGYTYSGSNILEDVAWYWSNCRGKTHPVGTKKANELGLYDMSGNVEEWCLDWLGNYEAGSVSDPKGTSSGWYRAVRGGAWCKLGNKDDCRVAKRGQGFASSASHNFGFRVVLAPVFAP